jgi:PAB-dependent poly(A)-specific ribonuclease subunit 3
MKMNGFTRMFEKNTLLCTVLNIKLWRDLESARIVRLLTKLNTVVDRSEFNMDPSWAETGDRYMLKLFRDFLFHQVAATGIQGSIIQQTVHCKNLWESIIESLMTCDYHSSTSVHIQGSIF